MQKVQEHVMFVILMTSVCSENSVLTVYQTKMIAISFEMSPSWSLFSDLCVFGKNDYVFHLCSNERPERISGSVCVFR